MMNKPFLMACLVLRAFCTNAQEKPSETPITNQKSKEWWIGIKSISNLNLSLGFKNQVSEKWFMNYRLFNLMYATNKLRTSPSTSPGQEKQSQNNISANVGVGIEKRHFFTDKLALFYGPELGAGYRREYSELDDGFGNWRESTHHSFSAGVGYTLGTLLNLKKGAFIALNITPSVYYSYMSIWEFGSLNFRSVKSDGVNLFISNSAFVFVGYRF